MKWDTLTVGPQDIRQFWRMLKAAPLLHRVGPTPIKTLWHALGANGQTNLNDAFTAFAQAAQQGEHVVGEVITGLGRISFTGDKRLVFAPRFNQLPVITAAAVDPAWLDAYVAYLMEHLPPNFPVTWGTERASTLEDLASKRLRRAAA